MTDRSHRLTRAGRPGKIRRAYIAMRNLEIVRLREFMTAKQLARRFNLAPKTIHNIWSLA